MSKRREPTVLPTIDRLTPARARRQVARRSALAPPLREKIVKALMHDRFLTKAAAEEAAFHLTDWITDLEELNRLFARKRWDPASARRLLLGFVSHAPNHLAAAHRILWDEPLIDIFELGAVKGTGRPKRKPGGPYSTEQRAAKSAR